MVMHGTLSSLIMRRETPDDEEAGDFRMSNERRLSIVLNGPHMRSSFLRCVIAWVWTGPHNCGDCRKDGARIV